MQIIEIILLAMVAAFIALRLKSVLGRRSDEPPSSAKPVPEKGPSENSTRPPQEIPGQKEEVTLDPAVAAGLKSVSDKNIPALKKIFGMTYQGGVMRFLDGAKRAYEMVLEGFWNGDMDQMAPYLDKDVQKQFEGAIRTRTKKGHQVDNRLVEILDVKIRDASIHDNKAEITLEFKSEIIAVLKNKSGKLIEGDLSDTIKVTDIWTFERDLGSKDPNWTLVATDAG